MSKKIGLPVYKASYDLFLCSFWIIKNLDKEYKYTVGEKVKNETMDLIMNIYRANKAKDKAFKKEKIEKAQENIEIVRLLFRLLHDLKQISLKHYVSVSEKIEDVSRQLFGWNKSLN